MTFKVQFSDEAERNVREIRDWIASHSPDGALRWLEALNAARQRLEKSAGNLALAPEADVFDEDLLQILFKTRRGNIYRALFVIRAETVHVVAVRGAGQDLVGPDDISLPN